MLPAMRYRHHVAPDHDRPVFRVEGNLYPGDEGVIREAVSQGMAVDVSERSIRGLNLSGLNLSGLIARKADLALCTFQESDLTGADFSYARLDQVDATSARLAHASLMRARGQSAVFDGADLTSVDMTYAVMPGVLMRQAELQSAKMQHASFSRGQFQGADATDLRAGILRAEFSDWSCATLRDAHLPLAILDGAIMAHCDVRGMKAFDAQARGIDVTGTDLSQASSLPSELSGAHSDPFRRHRSLQEVLANPSYWDEHIIEQEGMATNFRRQGRRAGS